METLTADDIMRAAVLKLARVPTCASEAATWALLEEAATVIDRDETERTRLEELLHHERVVT